MIYVFQNEESREVLEKSFPIGKCPENVVENGIVYVRLFTVPMIIVDSNKPKTVGALAEKNTIRMEKEGTLPPVKKKETPWWRKGKNKPDSSLAKMTSAQRERYIITGEK